MHKLISNNKGEGYIDVIITVLVVMILIALAVKVLPFFTVKNTLDNYAIELIREAEKAGRIGSETNQKIADLNTNTGFIPNVEWNCDYITGTTKVQLNGKMNVKVTYTVDIGFFKFGSFPIVLTGKASGKSEVFYK